MNKLQKLNRTMLQCEHNGDISEEEYATYKMLLEAFELLRVAAHALETPGDFTPYEMETQVKADIGNFLGCFEEQS
jgi:hypothetical protein